jgi:hypothetical protein
MPLVSQPALGIGNTPYGGGFPFIGLIDEVVLYSRALTPAEIASLSVPPTSLSAGLFATVTLTGQPGQTYAIQYSTDVTQTNWTTLTHLTLTQVKQLWVDTSVNAAVNPRRFYRAMLVP